MPRLAMAKIQYANFVKCLNDKTRKKVCLIVGKNPESVLVKYPRVDAERDALK